MKNINGFVSSQLDDHFPNMGTKILSGANQPADEASDFYHDGYHWAGLSKAEMVSHYSGLKALGVQQKEYYIVKFRPYKNNATKDVEFMANSLSGWLATSVSWPVLQVDTETKKAGNYSYSHITGRQFPEITMNFIETQKHLVLQSLAQLRNLTFNKDGTFKPPAEYAFWAEMTLYNRVDGVAQSGTKVTALCCLSAATLDMDASDHGALIVPLTFTRLRPFMRP